jgi:hypothetical protein
MNIYCVKGVAAYAAGIWYGRTGHRWQYGVCACLLDTKAYTLALTMCNISTSPPQQRSHERPSMLRYTTVPVLLFVSLIPYVKSVRRPHTVCLSVSVYVLLPPPPVPSFEFVDFHETWYGCHPNLITFSFLPLVTVSPSTGKSSN